MENKNPSMWNGLAWPVKAILIVIIICAVGWGAYSLNLIPGLSTEESKVVAKAEMSKESVNTTSKTDMLPVPNIDEMDYAEVDNRPLIKLMNWVWFGNAGIFSANGGLVTMKGTLMDEYGLNVRMITNNSVADMKREQLAFVNAFAAGEKNPEVGVAFVTVMGDGYPAYVSAMNQQIVKAFGPEYKLKVIGIAGFSLGEDCIMGPIEWKENPQSMKGCVISAVIGDGDWGLGVRFGGGDNGLKINPDPDTYDPEAMNFVPAPDDDFMKAAEDVIAGRVVELKVKDSNGKLTGKTIKKKIEGAGTWFPGDRLVAKKTGLEKVVSTSQYPNQMATVIVGCDKWMKQNSDLVVKFLSATLTATNQIKQHEEWFKYATELAPKVFCVDANECSETAEDWYNYGKPNGGFVKNQDDVSVSVGGTQMANLADNKKYFGLRGGNDYYRSVYEYFSNVIRELNPAGFMDNVDELTPYEDAIDLSYLKKVNIEAGKTVPVDYSKNKGEAFASRSWKIEFHNGKATITPEGEKVLEELFNALNIAENARVKIVGYTDDVGADEENEKLSLSRAKAVKAWLLQRSDNAFPTERFVPVEGKGEKDPIASNSNEAGRAQNRRVAITLLQ
ncbi:MAG TPA: OmpA family protein [Candidatus Paceibacterota bacterium]|nr:OmpA family protein [Candidatus Paceibacterota bacterium]